MQSAEDWRDTSTAETARADQAEGALAETEVALAETEDELEDLEGRITELAAEKAAVGDEREMAETERDFFALVTVQAADVTDQLRYCLDEQSYFYGVLVDSGPYSDWDWVLSLAEQADVVCNQAWLASQELDNTMAGL